VSSKMVAGVVLLLHCAHVFRLRGGKQVLYSTFTDTGSVGLDGRRIGVRVQAGKNYFLFSTYPERRHAVA
jgi:hypothetical protein